MSLVGFSQLYEHADSLHAPLPIAVAGGADLTVLQAVRNATDRGWIVPVVTGKERDIYELAQRGEISLQGFTIVDTSEPAELAVRKVRDGEATLLMKGQVTTPELMRAVLAQSDGLRTERSVAQVVLMEIAKSERRFLLADTGITIQPSLDQKMDIVRTCVQVAQQLGATEPRVALLAASENVVDRMPETVEADVIRQRGESGELGHCDVSGPLSFDLAYSTEAAHRKTIADPVVGRADVMIFPNLLSANLTVKAIMYTADCRFGGVLRGTRCPVVFMSRADTTQTRLNSIALALRLAS
jgi:phosphotransacetylase